MELKVGQYQLPEKISFNYEELKAELTKACEEYKSIAYTSETIDDAKKDRAKLNNLKTQLNSFRLEKQREYMEPFDLFKGQVDDLIGIIGDASSAIDAQVKEYETAQKEEKKRQITELFQKTGFPDWAVLEAIFDRRWLNKGKTLSEISDELASRKKKIDIDCNAIGRAFSDPSIQAAALTRYHQTLDVDISLQYGDAMAAEKKRVEEARAEAEAKAAKAAEEPAQEESAAIPQQKEESAAVSQQNPEPEKPEKHQRVTLAIEAWEHQFAQVNELIRGLRAAGVKYTIIEKEDI